MKLVDKYYIKKIDNKQAQEMVIKNHYLHRSASCSFAFGLFDKESKNLLQQDQLIGVVMYGTPVSAPLRRGVCGDTEKENVIELTRLWIKDDTEKNVESFLVGNTIRKIDKEIVVSFADPSQGHLGLIYQATNFYYTGLSAKRGDWKVKGIEKHSHTIADKYTSKELHQLYGDNFTTEPRQQKHRYIFFNCNTKRRNELISKLKYPILPYPKTSDYISSSLMTKERVGKEDKIKG